VDGKTSAKVERKMIASQSARRVLLGSSLFIACLLLYVQTFSFPFLTFDDNFDIIQNTGIREWSSIPSYFQGDLWLNPASPMQRYYRPMQSMWWLLNYKAFGLHPAAWHAALVCLQALAVLLFWQVLLAMDVGETVAFFSAMLFALHPVHVESVSWLSAVPDPLLTAFGFASMLAYFRWTRSQSIRWLMLCALLSICALWSKEVGITFPLALLLYDFWFAKPSTIVNVRRIAARVALVAVIGVYAIGRVFALHTRVVQQHPHSVAEVIRTAPLLIWLYFKQAFWPTPLSAWYGYSAVGRSSDLHFILPAIFFLALITVLLVGLRRRSLAAFWGAFWCFAITAPVLGVRVFERRDLFHDRYNFLPVAAICFIIVNVVVSLSAVRSSMRITALAVICLSFAIISVQQIPTWRSDPALYVHAVQVSPTSIRPRNLLLAELLRRGAGEEAVRLARATVEIDPSMWESNFSYGVALAATGRVAESDQVMRRCLELDSRKSIAYIVLSHSLESKGDREQALRLLESAPHDVDNPDQIKAESTRLRTQ
jgi:protein O-mannosyl-transferase